LEATSSYPNFYEKELKTHGADRRLQDFNSSNSLLLTSNLSGTLTLVTPAPMTTLALFGTSGNGPTSATVTVTFTDSSSSDYQIDSGSGITADWFNNGSNTAALAVGTGNRTTMKVAIRPSSTKPIRSSAFTNPTSHRLKPTRRRP
jgi:hypothetical protein